MLKITKREENGMVVLKLEGTVTEHWTAFLEGECRAFLRNDKTLLLDCAGVNVLDVHGVDMLGNLRRNKVTIIGLQKS